MADLQADTIELETMRSVMPKEHQATFNLIANLYGGESDAIINGLMDMTIRAAILAGVSAENFAAGMKHHWDAYAEMMNRQQN